MSVRIRSLISPRLQSCARRRLFGHSTEHSFSSPSKQHDKLCEVVSTLIHQHRSVEELFKVPLSEHSFAFTMLRSRRRKNPFSSTKITPSAAVSGCSPNPLLPPLAPLSPLTWVASPPFCPGSQQGDHGPRWLSWTSESRRDAGSMRGLPLSTTRRAAASVGLLFCVRLAASESPWEAEE